MIVLGWSGGPFLTHEPSGPASGLWGHDSAAVIVRDGEVVAAIEQERIDRIKHSDKAPLGAIQACLTAADLRPEQVERIAFGSSEVGFERALRRREIGLGLPRGLSARATIEHLFSSRFQKPCPPITFVKHHLAHAASAYYPSGFKGALVVTYDGVGEDESGLIARGRGGELEILARMPPWQSLGQYYCDVIAFLGYSMFDEYKVMGLAPYGDPSRFRSLFETFISLDAHAGSGPLTSGIAIHSERILELDAAIERRVPGGPFTQEHKDVAAALQESLERAAFHLIDNAARVTGLRKLALSGGVAHNCTLNGKLLKRFDAVYVQPASHDAGCALGAALLVARETSTLKPMSHVSLGLPLPEPDAIEEILRAWSGLVSFERSEDIARDTAEAIAKGDVFAWVQGRSEFGPRALGHRSIVADPRPAENKSRINEMVKKREGYRPFAPSVLVDEAHRFFEIEKDLALPYMTFVVRVKPESRDLLGAITHVDGSARVQTVSREDSPMYASLIQAFGERTGVPMVLNTSFNNHREPIVDSPEDALLCFLTTGLDGLALGPYILRKRSNATAAWLSGVPTLPAHISLRAEERMNKGSVERVSRLVSNEQPDGTLTISDALFRLLSKIDGVHTLGELIRAVNKDATTLLAEFLDALVDRKVCWRPTSLPSLVRT
ncbi:MAG: nodulation protein [Polyangiaceae bacterium]|nr:nodulation protein [Polyangiaceae bacterium]